MANTVKYDRDEVIEKATHLFWAKGFHATSMRNIQECIDMRPGSIYASFGSKEGLFKETLHFYTQRMLARLARYANEHDSPLEALKAFLYNAAQDCNQEQSNEMCMLVKTISELSSENAELLNEARQLMKAMEDAFAAQLKLAQAAGEIDQAQDPQRLARLLQMQLIGLKSYTRVNTQIEAKEMIEDAFQFLK